METLRQLLLVLHIVGIASLLGGFLTQTKGIKSGDVRVNPAMVHGAFTMLISGLGLVAVVENGLDWQLDHTKIGVKLAILVVITLLVWANRTKERVAVPVFGAIGALTLANIFIAVMWT